MEIVQADRGRALAAALAQIEANISGRVRAAQDFIALANEPQKLLRAIRRKCNWQMMGQMTLRRIHRPGVYAIYLDGTLGYIGSSRDIGRRMSEHNIQLFVDRTSDKNVPWVDSETGEVSYLWPQYYQTPWGKFTSVRVKIRRSRRSGDWLMHEYRLIRKLKPQFNIVHV